LFEVTMKLAPSQRQETSLKNTLAASGSNGDEVQGAQVGHGVALEAVGADLIAAQRPMPGVGLGVDLFSGPQRQPQTNARRLSQLAARARPQADRRPALGARRRPASGTPDGDIPQIALNQAREELRFPLVPISGNITQ
jgi:hypothetical protein